MASNTPSRIRVASSSLAFLEGANRANTIFAKTPPARVWIFSKRISFYPKGVEPKGSGTTAYAWFIWDKDAPGTTELKWFKPGYERVTLRLRF